MASVVLDPFLGAVSMADDGERRVVLKNGEAPMSLQPVNVSETNLYTLISSLLVVDSKGRAWLSLPAVAVEFI